MQKALDDTTKDLPAFVKQRIYLLEAEQWIPFFILPVWNKYDYDDDQTTFSSSLWWLTYKDTVHIAFQLYYLGSNVTHTPSFSDRQPNQDTKCQGLISVLTDFSNYLSNNLALFI